MENSHFKNIYIYLLSCINAKSYSQQQHRYVANIAHGYNKNKDLNNKELFIAVLAFIYIILSSEHSWGNGYHTITMGLPGVILHSDRPP